MDVAKSISEGLARNVLSAKVNGELRDANRPLPGDCTLALLTWNDDEGKATLWHSSAHLLAEAVEALYPGTKFGIGPPIENGFYYDIDLATAPSARRLRGHRSQDEGAGRQEEHLRAHGGPKADAVKYFTEKGDEYKLELIEA
jgi:threonyl-tRNA synthetase